MKNFSKKLLAITLPLAFVAVSGSASALTLTFDEDFIQHGTIIDDEYSSLGVNIYSNNTGGGPDLAVAYDTTERGGYNRFTNRDTDLTGNFGAGNALIIQENSHCDALICSKPDDEGSRPAGSLFVAFDYIIGSFSFDLIDIERPETRGAEVRYINGDGNRVGSIPYADLDGAVFGDNSFNSSGTISLAGLGVTTLEFFMGGSGAIDNISVSTVPLPASASIFALGLAGLGMFRRRLRKSKAVAK